MKKETRWVAIVLGLSAALAASSAFAQTVVLRAGFLPDPRIVAGLAGGPVNASVLSGSCVGWLPPRPQHRVVLTTPMGFFRIFGESQTDITLFVRTPTGQMLCADDTYGTNPGVDINSAPPGVYEVYVGTYGSGGHAPYTVAFTELQSVVPRGVAVAVPPGPPAIAVPPGPPAVAVPVAPYPQTGAHAVLSPGFMPDPHMMGGVSGGPISAYALNPQCRGYIGAIPSHNVTLAGFFPFVRFWASAPGDTTLFVRAPTGAVYCADDTYGFNPGVDIRGAPPGVYQVYVGSYSQGSQHAYTLGVTELPSSTPQGVGSVPAPPPVVMQPPVMPQQPSFGSIVVLATGFMPDPRMSSGFSGGPLQGSMFNPSCRGTMPVRAQHRMILRTPFAFLRVYAESTGDTTMMIRGPRGEVYCADDTYGLNPGIDMQGAMPGTYEIFIGTYGGGSGYPYTLGITELPHVHP